MEKKYIVICPNCHNENKIVLEDKKSDIFQCDCCLDEFAVRSVVKRTTEVFKIKMEVSTK